MIFCKTGVKHETHEICKWDTREAFLFAYMVSGHSLLLVPDKALGSYFALTLADAGRKEVFRSLEWFYLSTYKMQVDRKKKAVNDRDNH